MVLKAELAKTVHINHAATTLSTWLSFGKKRQGLEYGDAANYQTIVAALEMMPASFALLAVHPCEGIAHASKLVLCNKCCVATLGERQGVKVEEVRKHLGLGKEEAEAFVK
eukprot:scaffold122368_cov11-Tisochrysis_lutea.AAC.1